MKTDERYMRMAVELAKKAEGRTSPNPLVGAVVVRNKRVVGKGYHKKAGSFHAEVIALRQAASRAKGATLYVSLEPCDHFGRTPPCTDEIIRSGVRSVVIGMKDPNPVNNGRGIRKLNRYGIKTAAGVLEEDAASINRPYIKFITKRMPYVTVKVAQSLDGKIATRSGDSKWISSEESRRYVHDLRGKVDAVMVGANTVAKDDPGLLSRTSEDRQPARVIVDGALKTPLGSRIFKNIKESPVFIFTAKDTPRIRRYEAKGAKVFVLKSKAGRVDLKDVMKALARRGILHVLVEGGGELIAGLVEDEMVDRFLFFIAAKIIGGAGAVTSVEGEGAAFVKDAAVLKNLSVKRFKDDILIEASVR